jgi:hypothetical protein
VKAALNTQGVPVALLLLLPSVPPAPPSAVAAVKTLEGPPDCTVMPSPCVLALASSMRTLPLRARQSGSSSGGSSAQGEVMHMRLTTVQYTILHYTILRSNVLAAGTHVQHRFML